MTLNGKRGPGVVVILGIDPGYAIVGYGAISYHRGAYASLGYGAVLTEADTDFARRLSLIYDNMREMIAQCKPDALAIEKLFFYSNQTTAIGVAEARGVILLAASQAGVPIFEYTPLQVKVAVTGYGHALKPQVMEMTRRLLKLKETPKPDDAADALAIAICHAHASGSSLRRNIINR